MKGLTTDYHEDGIALAVNEENQFTYAKGFYFQLSSRDRKKSKTPWGPMNPQALNRYSYVLNNPLRYTDPTGHATYVYQMPAADFSGFLAAYDQGVSGIRNQTNFYKAFLFFSSAYEDEIFPGLGMAIEIGLNKLFGEDPELVKLASQSLHDFLNQVNGFARQCPSCTVTITVTGGNCTGSETCGGTISAVVTDSNGKVVYQKSDEFGLPVDEFNALLFSGVAVARGWGIPIKMRLEDRAAGILARAAEHSQNGRPHQAIRRK